MTNKKLYILIPAIILLLIGAVGPYVSNVSPKAINVTEIKTVVPQTAEMKEACAKLSAILQTGKSKDALRLASLYSDLSDLIALDGDNEIIQNTEEIRQANKISGVLLQLDLKDKYEGLAEAADNVVVTGMGNDEIPIDSALREKAVETFRTLAWACKEGSK